MSLSEMPEGAGCFIAMLVSLVIYAAVAGVIVLIVEVWK